MTGVSVDAAPTAPRPTAPASTAPVAEAEAEADLWYTRCPVPTASSVAIAGGWLTEEFAGSDVTLASLRARTDPAHRRRHFTNDRPAMVRHGGIVPPIWARAGGADLRLIGITRVPRFAAIVATVESGLEDPQDLAGRRLALPRRPGEPVDFWHAQTLRALTLGLRQVGLSEGAVTLVDLVTDLPYHAPNEASVSGSLWTAREAARLQRPELAALIRGEVDAIYTYGPLGLQLLELAGLRVVVDLTPPRATASGSGSGSGSGIDTLTALTVSTDLLEQRPEVVARYLAALLRASAWASRNRSSARRIFSVEEGVAEEWTELAYGDELYRSLQPELSASLIGELQGEADFLFDRALVPGRVDVAAWVAPEPLRRAEERQSKSEGRGTP